MCFLHWTGPVLLDHGQSPWHGAIRRCSSGPAVAAAVVGLVLKSEEVAWQGRLFELAQQKVEVVSQRTSSERPRSAGEKQRQVAVEASLSLTRVAFSCTKAKQKRGAAD